MAISVDVELQPYLPNLIQSRDITLEYRLALILTQKLANLVRYVPVQYIGSSLLAFFIEVAMDALVV